MRLLETIQGCQIIETTGNRVVFIADADIDCDGINPNYDHDPYYQNDTSYHHEGKALDAYVVPYVVVPPVILQKTVGTVLGCQCFLTNLNNGTTISAVVGDIGPRTKIGEISVAAAKGIGLDGNPNHGGTSDHVIGYELLPGVGASVGGIVYELQKYG